MRQRVFHADPAGVLADHYAQCRPRLQAIDCRGVGDGLAVLVAGIGRLDEQHWLDRRLFVGRRVEGGEVLLQQALVVQGDAEQVPLATSCKARLMLFSWR